MTAAVSPIDAKAFRAALGRFATGVTLVTTQGPDGRPIGLTVSSFNSVSLTPPLVLWSLSLGSSSQPYFDTAVDYAINVLAADQIELARLFSTRPLAERFDGVEWTAGLGGAPVIAGSAAVFLQRREASQAEVRLGQLRAFLVRADVARQDQQVCAGSGFDAYVRLAFQVQVGQELDLHLGVRSKPPA